MAAMTPEERQRHTDKKQASELLARAERQGSNEQWEYGSLNSAMICPHCKAKGKIRTKGVVEKKGASGAFGASL
jgi:hypothetical protein